MKGEKCFMEIYRKITPTCVKENLERKEKLLQRKEAQKNSNLEEPNQNLSNQSENNVEQRNNDGMPPNAPNLNESPSPNETPNLDNGSNEGQNSSNNETRNLPPNNNQNPSQNNEQEPNQNGEGQLNQNETQNSIFESNEPYPEVTAGLRNQKDIRTLKALAFGRDGELTAILTHIFQHTVLPNDLGTLKEILRQIAIVEMKHYEALSEAIVKLGGTPTLTDGKGNVWTGRNVSSITNPKRILETNAKGEREAIATYNRVARETENESLSLLYKRIAEDEKLHLEIFEKLLEVLN